jgi:hypothetical protein
MSHPDIVSELAKLHQRELLEEAKKNKLIKQIRVHRPRFADHLLLSFSEFLIAQGRKLEKRVCQRSGDTYAGRTDLAH